MKQKINLYKVGERIKKKYEVHKVMEGGMGIVYLCYDHESGNPYALKTLKKGFLSAPRAKERFRIEAEIWVKLEKHKNIVRAVYVKEIDNIPYIFMEYITGGDLGVYIKQGMLLEQILDFAIQFCRGMDYAYRKLGVIHRDIKPSNILVTQDKVIKVTDFGLAKLGQAERWNDLEDLPGESGTEENTLTRTGAALGTPCYMSPEQFCNSKEVDVCSDIYSFGVVLYEMLTGKPLFVAESISGLRDSHLHKKPSHPREFLPDLPGAMDRLVMKCLEKDPLKRYGGFYGLMGDLQVLYREITGQEIGEMEGSEKLEAWEIGNKGGSLAELGKEEEAMACFDQALGLDPRNARIWYNKGVVLNSAGMSGEAITCFDHALELNPEDAYVWFNKGVELDNLERREEAIACYDQACKLDPQYTDAWSNKGVGLYLSGQSEEATACFDRALKLDSQNAGAWYNKGNALAGLGQYEKAINCFDAALELDPHYIKAWSNKGIVLINLGRFEEALACCDKAIRLNPRNARVWHCKGSALAGLGRYEEAVSCYENNISLNPRNTSVWNDKGTALVNLKRLEEALSAFEQALIIEPEDECALRGKALCLEYLKKIKG